MAFEGWNLKVVVLASLWASVVGLLFNYAVLGDVGSFLGWWLAVILALGAIYFMNNRERLKQRWS